MADREVKGYVAGQELMDGYQIMRKVIDSGETAVVRDLGQTGDNGVKGDYYDAYVNGELILSCDTQSEAQEAIRNEVNKKQG